MDYTAPSSVDDTDSVSSHSATSKPFLPPIGAWYPEPLNTMPSEAGSDSSPSICTADTASPGPWHKTRRIAVGRTKAQRAKDDRDQQKMILQDMEDDSILWTGYRPAAGRTQSRNNGHTSGLHFAKSDLMQHEHALYKHMVLEKHAEAAQAGRPQDADKYFRALREKIDLDQMMEKSSSHEAQTCGHSSDDDRSMQCKTHPTSSASRDFRVCRRQHRGEKTIADFKRMALELDIDPLLIDAAVRHRTSFNDFIAL